MHFVQFLNSQKLTEKNKKAILYFLFCLPFIVRLIAVLIYKDFPITGDAVNYHYLANSILEGKGLVSFDTGNLSSLKPPLYPLFLAVVYFLLGSSYFAAQLANAVIGGLSCILFYAISKAVLKSTYAVWLSFFLLSFYPPMVLLSTLLLTENIFVFMVLLAVYCGINLFSKENVYLYSCFFGFFSALATLTRPVFLFFIFLFLLYFLVQRLRLKQNIIGSLKITALSFFVFLCTLSPWAIRNYLVHNTFVLITTQGGYGLYASNNPKNGRLYGLTPSDHVTDYAEENFKSEVEKDKYLFKKGVETIVNNPIKMLKLGMLKIIYFWAPIDWEILGLGKGNLNVMFAFIIPFFIFGITSFSINNDSLAFNVFLLTIAYFFFMCLIFYGSPRFRLPVDPFIIIISAHGIISFFNRYAKKVYPVLYTTVYSTALIFLSFNTLQLKNAAKGVMSYFNIW